MSAEIKEGDTVCLRIHGEVDFIDAFGRLLIGGKLYGTKNENTSVEVLERRKPEVGDKVQGPGLLELPAQAVLRSTMNNRLYARMDDDDAMLSLSTGTRWPIAGIEPPMTLVYLP